MSTRLFKQIIPALENSKYKGQSGKVAVVGGCFEYTGAPYMAAISAVRCGADLGYVFCSRDAGPPIKSYGPELIVFPYLRTHGEVLTTLPSSDFSLPQAMQSVYSWISRLNAVIVGPGLGRETTMLESASSVIKYCCQNDIALVIDADGLFLLETYPDVLNGHRQNIVLTPNANEFRRLCAKFIPNELKPDDQSEDAKHHNLMSLAKKLNVVVCQKGQVDCISDGNTVLVCDTQGAKRRCGGIGDILSGVIGCFSSWVAIQQKEHGFKEWTKEMSQHSPLMVACQASCNIVRLASREAFAKQGRSLVANDIIPYIGGVFSKSYEWPDVVSDTIGEQEWKK